MAPSLQVDQDLDAVRYALANISRPWLLIFDNADDPDLSLTGYFPPGDRGDMVITSRNPACQQYSTVGSREVGCLLPTDALALLTKTVTGIPGERNNAPTHEDSAGLQVVTTLGCLALAVVQAGAYMRELSCSYNDYLELYHLKRQEVLTYAPNHSGTDYRHTVYTTWQVSLNWIESMGDAVSQRAVAVLRLLCFYHYEQVPVEMFSRAWQNSRETPHKLQGALWTNIEGADEWEHRHAVKAAVSCLASFSLVIQDANALLSIHPLVHEWCRERLVQKTEEDARCRAMSVLATSIPWGWGSNDYTYRRCLVPHVHTCLKHSSRSPSTLDVGMTDEWLRLALVLSENGSINQAMELLQEVVALQKSKCGLKHPETLRSMHSLSSIYNKAGRHEEALQLTETVVDLYKSELGVKDPHTLRSMHSLANRYRETGQHEKALQLTEEVVAIQESELGAEHLRTLGSMHSLATSYNKVGRQEEGLQLLEKVVAQYKSKLGMEHPYTLGFMYNLANSYWKTGRKEEALQLTEKVVDLQKSKIGAEHPDTLRSMKSLAINYHETGQQKEALQLMEKVVALQKSKLGAQHPDTLGSIRVLAHMHKNRRDTPALTIEPTPSLKFWQRFKHLKVNRI